LEIGYSILDIECWFLAPLPIFPELPRHGNFFANFSTAWKNLSTPWKTFAHFFHAVETFFHAMETPQAPHPFQPRPAAEEGVRQVIPSPAKSKLPKSLLADIRSMIQAARGRVALLVNNETTLLYWNVGRRINQDVLDGKRAAYGEQIVSTLSAQLQQEFGGQGFETRNLRRMMQFAERFPNPEIVATLSRQLSWSHFVGEASPLGLILCADGGREQIELLQLDKAGIRVAQYLTELPDKKLLKRELRLSLEQAREHPGEAAP
jgi:hypothetical protein